MTDNASKTAQNMGAAPPPAPDAPQVVDTLAELWKPLGEWGDWLNEIPPRRAWLLSGTVDGKPGAGVLPLGKVGMVAGAGSAGKSWLATQLALAVATGTEWMGLQVDEPGRVVLALGEEEPEEAQRRLFYAAEAAGLSDSQRAEAARRIWVLPLAGRPVALTGEEPANRPSLEASNKRDPADGLPVTAFFWNLVERLEQGAGSKDFAPWRLVILDPLSRFAGLEVESDNAAATRFVQAVERLTAPLHGHPTVLLWHHTNKASRKDGQSTASDAAAATAARGMSALTDGVRWQANIEALKRYEGAPELVSLAVVKNNYGRYPQPVKLMRGAEGALRVAAPEEWKDWEGRDRAARRDEEGEAAAKAEKAEKQARNEAHRAAEGTKKQAAKAEATARKAEEAAQRAEEVEKKAKEVAQETERKAQVARTDAGKIPSEATEKKAAAEKKAADAEGRAKITRNDAARRGTEATRRRSEASALAIEAAARAAEAKAAVERLAESKTGNRIADDPTLQPLVPNAKGHK